jgi:hypothetical protein
MAVGLIVTRRRGGCTRSRRWRFLFLWWSFPFSVLFFLYRAIFSERGVWVFRVVVHIRNTHNFIVYATLLFDQQSNCGIESGKGYLAHLIDRQVPQAHVTYTV